ncbi:MAG: hypothetical protein QGH85_00320 [Candidatus Pacebacteria bacterium]|jgi:phosphotransferase system  glucose/maltose/N-acetylglucosamine-specific IIC component|nr:hypothetical protein [Candidatus Paceibacterota bacterium]MDP7159264.1 hypothetical protein [Candidatus Paceibacterota bacterium]MDP7466068.1 hypothetical protein [Candidatus Paceibacterota bacterium]MDP7648235.1 hypothetical protein [Candidatus Paceibacterota bacterium]HJO89719.1 hypothetical protein [Candidatus Paceibacterota bacterium]|tara:strand:+ start:380 stop:517 length:138 start_codon:yes stop_codon:yes gene_type:complete
MNGNIWLIFSVLIILLVIGVGVFFYKRAKGENGTAKRKDFELYEY